MRTSSEKILILILFGWAPFLLYSQGSSSENDLLKHKRPPLPKHTGFIETVSSNNHEEKEERETPPANTFSTHTRKKKLKKTSCSYRTRHGSPTRYNISFISAFKTLQES